MEFRNHKNSLGWLNQDRLENTGKAKLLTYCSGEEQKGPQRK